MLAQFKLSGCILNIVALGCQTAIAKQIIEQYGEHVFGLNGNQGMLHSKVEESFAHAQATHFADIAHDFHKTVDKGHSRLESLQYWMITDAEYLHYLNADNAWSKLRSFGMIKSGRRIGNKTTKETHYYITSLSGNVQAFGTTMHSHWEIENSVHWILDIAFQEDANRMRKDHSPENFTTLRHMALNLLKHDRNARCGTKAKRLKAGWSEDYHCKMLTA